MRMVAAPMSRPLMSARLSRLTDRRMFLLGVGVFHDLLIVRQAASVEATFVWFSDIREGASSAPSLEDYLPAVFDNSFKDLPCLVRMSPIRSSMFLRSSGVICPIIMVWPCSRIISPMRLMISP